MFLKQILKETKLYSLCKYILNYISIIRWRMKGKPIPPPHILKQQVIKNFAKQFKVKILVETGTYYGEMVAAMKDEFDHIYSIELSMELFDKAKKRFVNEENITLIHGDSGKELKKLLEKLDKPAIFWLDGHYSGGETARGEIDTPILEELSHIFNSPCKGHIIIIDDARCFGIDPSYPSVEYLKRFVKLRKPSALIDLKDDSIRIFC